MRLSLLMISIFLISADLKAQQAPQERAILESTILRFFDGMRKGDSTLSSSAMSKNIVMQTVTGTGNTVRVRTEDPKNFLKMVGTPHKEVYDERITFDHVQIDGSLAAVWTPYKFYIGSKLSHCGVNSFTLTKEAGEWKILHVIDTRRQEGCE